MGNKKGHDEVAAEKVRSPRLRGNKVGSSNIPLPCVDHPMTYSGPCIADVEKTMYEAQGYSKEAGLKGREGVISGKRKEREGEAGNGETMSSSKQGNWKKKEIWEVGKSLGLESYIVNQNGSGMAEAVKQPH